MRNGSVTIGLNLPPIGQEFSASRKEMSDNLKVAQAMK